MREGEAQSRYAGSVPPRAGRPVERARPRRLLPLAVLAAVVLSLTVPPSAGADLGIVGWYDFSVFPEPNELSDPRDAVVNGSGVGGVDPGDFYVADQGAFSGDIGASINQYDVDGDRVRIFGEDVVASGPGQSNERQSVAIFATGGTFRLTFGGETTPPLAFDASPATVESALNALSSIGGVGAAVSVSGGPGSADGSTPYLVTFTGAQGGASQPLLVVDHSGLTGPGATALVASPNKGGVGKEICELGRGDVCKRGTISYSQIALNESTGDIYALGNSRIERYDAQGEYELAFGFDAVKFGPNDGDTDEVNTLTIKATGGTFTLSTFHNGSGESPPIPYDATAEQVEEAINAMPNVGTAAGGSVTVTGGPGDELGSNPYVITFGGANAGDDIGNFTADATNLTGPEKEASIVTTTQGGEAEICTLADVCNSAFSQSERAGSFQQFRASMTIAPPDAPNAGNVLIADSKVRVQEFDADGNFVRLFGWDVVADGPNQNREPQLLVVFASGGTYTLSFEGATTGPIAYNAAPTEVEAELNALSTISGAGASVSVTGGPGNNGGTNPYVVTFEGSLAGTNPPFLVSDPSGLEGGGFQGPRVHVGGGFSVCVAGEECRAGVHGPGLGQLSQHVEGLAVDSTGAIYTSDARYGGGNSNRINYRVQKFVPSGGLDLTPELFGNDEVQRVTVRATGGSFRLGIVDPHGARARGSFGSNQMTINNVTFEQGTFEVGMPLDASSTGAPGSRVAGVSGNTVELTKPINLNCGNCVFSAPEMKYTADLPANATAAEVEAALNELGPIKAKGGSVSVSGGPGDANGSNPYVITFDGGTIARTAQPQLVWAQGGTPLSGGSGPGADEATVETVTNGGPNAQNTGLAEDNGSPWATDSYSPLSLDVGPDGRVIIARNYPPAWDSCESGLPAWKEVRVEEFTTSGDFVDISKPCTQLRQAGGSSAAISQISFNRATGQPYMWHPEDSASKPDGSCCENRDRLYLLGDVGTKPSLTVDPASNLSPTGATISGTINPNGPGDVAAQVPASTKYRVEFKRTTETEWEVYAPDVSVGGGTSPVPFNVGISGLTPKADYEARVVVTKPFGFEPVSDVVSFTTLAAAPVVNAVSASHITASSADLHALINPLGTTTSYWFEYGTTPAYGQKTPEVTIGDSLSPVEVVQHVEGLEPVVYHFRVVAKNALGETVSTNQTFNFYPEPCPNATVRQQTGSGSLPDCRAYELVSPGDAGSATLLPGGANSGYANPPRLAFMAGLGSIPGPWNPPNAAADMYVATRSSAGWNTFYVGIPGDEAGATTGPPNGEGDPLGGFGSSTQRGEVMTSLEMDRFIGWNPGQQGFTCCGLTGSMSPYVFDAQGRDLGRWPTNAAEVVGGLEDMACWTNAPLPPCGPPGGYGGDVRPSGDFSHYFFSSGNVAFHPDGQTSGIGSVYDNEIESRSVTVASRKPDGSHIEREPKVTTDDYMALPGVSIDGSHILMAASGSGICGKFACDPMPFPCGTGNGGFDNSLTIQECPPLPASHLYMRVDGAVTYDVSQGHLVNFQAITDDGSKVFFTSLEQLTPDDSDTSVDLFMWDESIDDIVRVSAGPGSVGDTDACNSSWVQRCGIEIVTPRVTTFGGFEGKPVNNAVDAHGGVYFYSPEQFVGSNGIPGRRNLYYARDGQVQYVATLDSDSPATRFQVTRNGAYAAFIADTRLTAYENDGFAHMYRFNTETGALVCVSCPPSGAPSNNDVEGSQNGLYITEDGRTFFTTRDPLVSQDTNGLNDVYEFVSGRPQLISTGISNRDVTGLQVKTGLIGVSADGIDVYFSTVETLVPADRNGAFLKFYDARTNGGFPTATTPAPCAAADECHGPGTPALPAPTIGSTADLGQRGNVRPSRRKAKKQRRKRRAKKHRRRARKGASRRKAAKKRKQRAAKRRQRIHTARVSR